MAHDAALHWVMILALGTFLIAIFQRFGVSSILGYLATGILSGPSGLGWVKEGAGLDMFAELGVVLLMFTIGLEFSLPKLLAAKRLVIGLGGAQVIITTAVFAALLNWSGLDLSVALLLGGALAMSSTAIVLKQLGEQAELNTSHGRMSTGILLFQDIAAVPLLVALPIMASGPANLTGELNHAIIGATLVFSGLMLFGRYLLPRLLEWVAESRSLELFSLTAILLVMIAATVSSAAGLSPTLGAFMAGALLGESSFRHQIEADIRPFRDLMLGLFFVTVGMRLDLSVVVGSFVEILTVVIALVGLKPILIASIARGYGYKWLEAIRAAISLAQGGEFGLLVLSVGLTMGLFSPGLAQPLMAAVILSMILTPVLVKYNREIAFALAPPTNAEKEIPVFEDIASASEGLEKHVIVCGFGRLGQNVMEILQAEGISSVALDLDLGRVKQASAAGEPVMFGNASQADVLKSAGIDHASALAITVGDVNTAEKIVHQAQLLNPKLPVLARSRRGRDDEGLIEAGATVFPESMESSLAFAGQLMVMVDVPPSVVEARLNLIRAEDYAPLKAFFHAARSDKALQESLDFPQEIKSIVLKENHHAVGLTVHELGITDLGVSLLDVRRGAIKIRGDQLDTRLRVGDVLVLKGEKDALNRAAQILAMGN